MKRTIRKSYYGNFRKRYPKLKRAVMIQRAFVATSRHFGHKVAANTGSTQATANSITKMVERFAMRRIGGKSMDKQRTIIVILVALVLMLTTIILDLFGVMG